MADEIVGSAYVVLRAITSRIKDDIRDGVKKGASGAKRDLEDAGATIGETVGVAAGEAAGENITTEIERTSRRHRGRHRAIGSGIGSSISSGLGRGMRKTSSIISKALTRGGKLLESARETGKKIGTNIKKGLEGSMPDFKSLLIPALVAVVPLLTSTLSALTGALTAFIGAAAQSAYASFALVGIFGTLKQTTGALKIATGGLAEAIKGEDGAMAKLAGPAQKVAKVLKEMTPEWTALKKAVQGATFRGLAPLVQKLGESGGVLETLRSGLVGTGVELNKIFKKVGRFVTSASFVERFGKALKGNNQILKILGGAARPILNGILNVYNALIPAAKQLARGIRAGAKSFSNFSNSKKNMDDLFDKFVRGRIAVLRLWRIVRNLGSVLRNVFGAAVGPGNGLLKTLVKLTGRFKRFTELASTKSSIAKWAQTGIDVSGRLFKGLGKGFKLIAPLFNPDLANKYFDVFEKVIPTITRIVKVVQKALAPIIDKVGKAFEKNGPKIAALFEALGPLLSGVGSVIGEVISQSLDLLGTIASVITPVVAAISGFIGPLLTKFAPIIAAIILSFTNWGGAMVKIIPVIGKVLAPLIRLASFILKKIAPSIKFLGKIVFGTFKLIGKIIFGTIGGVFKIIGKVFGFIGKYVPTVVKNIAGAVGRFFGRIRDAVVNTVSKVWSKITSGFDRVVKFLGKLPGRVTTAVAGLWNGLRDGFVSVINFIIDKWNNLSFTIPEVDLGPLGKLGGGTINFPDIPKLATGGRATRGTLAVIGEGKEAETVLPDSVLGDLLEKANSAGQSRGQGARTVNNTIINPEPERASKSVSRTLSDAASDGGWTP